MSSAIIPLDTGTLPAYLKNREALAQINSDVLASGPSFPVLSIKGKVFTMVKGGEKKLLTRIVDGEEEPRPTVTVSVVRANVKSRVFYAKAYEEGESEGVRPTCYSNDGVAPGPNALEPQAKKCDLCPHAVWGSRVAKPGDKEGGKGTACSVNTRLAVIDPENPDTPFLLRVPAGSKANYREVVKLAENRSIPYNALVLRVGFDPEASGVKLMFKPVGVLPDDTYAKVSAAYDSDEIKEIVGLIDKPVEKPQDEPEAPAAPKVDTSELDAALAAKKAVEAAKAPAVEAAKAPVATAKEVEEVVKPAKDEKPKAKAKETKPAEDASAASLLGELDALLSMKDD